MSRPAGGPLAGAAAAAALAGRADPLALALLVLMTLAAAVVPIAAAWLTKLVLDGLAAAGGLDAGALAGRCAVLGGVGVVAALLPQAVQYVRAELERGTGLLTQDRLYAAVGRFGGLARFEDPAFLDRLRLAEQSARTSPIELVTAFLGVGRGLLTCTGFVVSLAVLSPVMTGLVLIGATPMLLAELGLSRDRAQMLWDVSPTERREMFYGRLLSSAAAAKEIRLFGSGGFLHSRMLAERRAANAARRRLDRRELLVQSGLGLLAAAVAGAGLVWAGLAAASGRLTVGDVAMFVAAVAGVQAGLSALVAEVAMAHQELLQLDHYLAVVRAAPDLPAPERPRRLPRLRRGIELRDVWFRYSDEHPWVLRGVDMHLPHGRATALVGHNGAGKSTLVKLLCRFYDPTRGAILWDGVDLRNVPLEELRSRIGAVFQDYMCYELTAAENVALGDLSALGDQDRVEAAARRAGIHGVLAGLPQGYATLLSREFYARAGGGDPATGVVLSGGQWQRLALARAFVRDRCELMILDEPSAGLDAEAEHQLHARLREHRTGRTSLLISHRLGAVRDADLIVVLAGGSVVEQGGHGALTAAGGTYARLFTLQARSYGAGRSALGDGVGWEA